MRSIYSVCVYCNSTFNAPKWFKNVPENLQLKPHPRYDPFQLDTAGTVIPA